ncbi:nuclear transport factor 2 family protein [Saccharothrix sp. MB29]|nr:nuclear transport factor 2 family protein [Saccharothrix sp. MB29]
MNAALEFKARVESGDVVGATGLFADDVVLHSPVKFRPFEGIDAVRAVPRAPADLRGLPLRRQYDGERARAALPHPRGGQAGRGIDLLELDDEAGSRDHVMIRPQSA